MVRFLIDFVQIWNAIFFTLATLYLYPDRAEPRTDPNEILIHKSIYYGGLSIAVIILLLVTVKLFKRSVRGSKFILALQTLFSLASVYTLLLPHHNPAQEEVNMQDLVAAQFGDPIAFISRIVLLLSLGLIFVISSLAWIKKPKNE